MTADESLLKLESALRAFRDMTMFEGYEISRPESRGMDGDTPLHVAAMEGRLDLLRDMLPFVTDINTPGDLGNTPLHCAVLWNQPAVARLLIAHGATVDQANEYSDTPRKLMAGRPGFEEFLSSPKG